MKTIKRKVEIEIPEVFDQSLLAAMLDLARVKLMLDQVDKANKEGRSIMSEDEETRLVTEYVELLDMTNISRS